MQDELLLRYSRQIMLPQIDIAGQQRLLQSTVIIIGLGGLGSPVAMYLAAAGVGHLVIVDFDQVDLSNLQRQILHGTPDLNKPKTQSARETLSSLNPEIRITTIEEHLDEQSLANWVRQTDLVVDASDNFSTRFLINKVCVETRKPLVSAAVIRMEGQVTVFPNDGDGPCYRCLYRDEAETELRCSETGILAPVAGIIGSIQATEALKCLLGIGETLAGRLLILDALRMEWRSLRLRRDTQCPVCTHTAPNPA
jgi:adenylyltransferase/sulfurtransferase